MELTIGGMFFYGGIVGLGFTILLAIIAGFVLGGGRKKLRKEMDEEYGISSS